jgi:hypothetical protein
MLVTAIPLPSADVPIPPGAPVLVEVIEVGMELGECPADDVAGPAENLGTSAWCSSTRVLWHQRSAPHWTLRCVKTINDVVDVRAR